MIYTNLRMQSPSAPRDQEDRLEVFDELVDSEFEVHGDPAPTYQDHPIPCRSFHPATLTHR
jgi:hypothetical protein